MEGADPAASTGVFTLDYEALGLNRYHRHEVEDAADGGSGAVNPNSIEAREGRLDDAVAATQLRFREGNKDSMYVPGPDAVEKDGAPAGEMISFKNWSSSTVYPDTTRDWHIYIPAAYSAAAQPAKLMVFNDGVFYFPKSGPARATIVFDNLIASGEMPVTIGVFVNPGLRDGRDRDIYQRSVEYDTVSEVYSTFLETEILPVVEQHANISSDPLDRAICGASSGGIAAFSAAWFRPDLFSRVMSHIGSFTNIRGGHNYPAMIRHTPRKALAKVYLQSGEYDIDNVHGSWPLANKEMFSALAFAGYDAKLEFGEGTHSVAHGGAVLPDALRWLWADDGENVNGASGSVKATVAVVTPGGGGTGGIARL